MQKTDDQMLRVKPTCKWCGAAFVTSIGDVDLFECGSSVKPVVQSRKADGTPLRGAWVMGGECRKVMQTLHPVPTCYFCGSRRIDYNPQIGIERHTFWCGSHCVIGFNAEWGQHKDCAAICENKRKLAEYEARMKAEQETEGEKERNAQQVQASTIDNNFIYHPPKGTQAKRYEDMREHFREMAHYINTMCPNSREKALALTKLEESMFWANASVARNE